MLLIGSTYMLSIPLTVLTTHIFEPYERQYVYILMSQSMMYTASFGMFWFFTSSRSSYRQINLDDKDLPHSQ